MTGRRGTHCGLLSLAEKAAHLVDRGLRTALSPSGEDPISIGRGPERAL
jgi:hypothetical protein